MSTPDSTSNRAPTTTDPLPTPTAPLAPASRPDRYEFAPAGVLIDAIANRKLKPTTLSAARRQDCVAYLLQQGFTNDQIARSLWVSDRTITRDRQAIRQAQALTLVSGQRPEAGGQRSEVRSQETEVSGQPSELRTQNAELTPQNLEPNTTTPAELLGEFQSIALASIQRLTLLARDKRVPAYTRLSAEEAITRTYQRFITLAERLGAFPRKDGQTEESQAPLSPKRRELSQANATLLIAINTVDGTVVQSDAKRQTIDLPRLESKP